MPLPEQHRCIRCGALETQMSREGCGNPGWHASQPGACSRCVCDQDEPWPCGCCHVQPCQMQKGGVAA